MLNVAHVTLRHKINFQIYDCRALFFVSPWQSSSVYSTLNKNYEFSAKQPDGPVPATQLMYKLNNKFQKIGLALEARSGRRKHTAP